MIAATSQEGSRFCRFPALACLVSVLAGCATLGDPNPTPAPPESRFVRLQIPGTGSNSFPAWRTRSPGRPLLLFHAVNGLSPEVLHFALELESWGYRVYLPSLYGDPIDESPAFGYDKDFEPIRILRQDGRWNPVSTESTGPILDDAEAMARWVIRKEGGRDIVVMGNSLTGNFPLELLDVPGVRVAVLGQPALPARRLHAVLFHLPQPREKQRSFTVTGPRWDDTVRALRSDPDKRIVGFHYRHDPMAPVVKFDALHETLSEAGLGNRFTAYVLETPRSNYVEKRADWVTGETTKERRRLLIPHSTYIDAENEADEKWFRDRLREALRAAW